MSEPQSDDADRQALLELLLAEEGFAVAPTTSLARRDPGSDPVLSYAQERLWFLQQFEDDTSALAIRMAVRVRGPLDVAALRSSLDVIVVRHASLRTLITTVGGRPEPRVMDVATMPLLIDDLEASTDAEADLAAILDEEARRVFDLERELPIMCRLVRLGDEDHVVSVVMHHVASDGWSFRVFARDLDALYTAHVRGDPARLPDLPVDYFDYAAWQRTMVSGENLARQLSYWTEQLAGPLPICEVPTDYARPPMHTFEGGQVGRDVGATVSADLRTLAAAHGATPFMVLLAAFDVVLARHMGHDDVIVGTPVAGRVRPELEGMIGMFLNTLVLRVDLSADPSFTSALERVRDTSLAAFDHQDVSFEQLLAELRPPRDLSRTPLFQVFFNMMNFGDANEDEDLLGLRHEVLAQPDLGSKFDLTMYVSERDGSFDLLLVYNRNLYAADTMRQLLDQYVQLLELVAADPTRPISAYSLVTPEAVVVLPDDTAPLDATWHGSVPSAVRRAAERTPDHEAVVDHESSWTYRDLTRHMDAVAAWLGGRGIGTGHVVAIYGHRSASLVCAVTGVLAAGAAYVLLDPRYPPGRLATYLRTARPDAWLAIGAAGAPPPEVDAALDSLGVGPRMVIPGLAELEAAEHGRPPPDAAALAATDAAIGPDDLASLTFTSGSTGEPKAVMGRHGSLTHFLPWQSERFEVGPGDRFSMLSGLAHDPIQRDMFWALWAGATIVVPDPEHIATPGWLADWLHHERVTVAHLTPAMGQLIAEGGATGRTVHPVHSLRRAFFIGEALTRRDVEQLHRLAPGVMVVNLYGTTETQRASGYSVVGIDDHAAGSTGVRPREVLPLGVGIADTQLLVRDDQARPVGFGEIGEIWVRSPHLALGYLDRPQDTAGRFVVMPGGDERDRAYRTGDRGRFLWNGDVEYVGRDDGQVQVRGFRVELGEIRAAVVDHPDVRDAVIVERSGHPGLVAYVVPSADRFDADVIMRGLRARLPGHMVPTDWVTIAAVPLTPNGKVDRAALPDPMATLHASSAVEPRDELERRLVGWWEQVLGRAGIGIHDNFFDLGGYSLLATRLFAMIEAETGQRIPVSALFEAPTVAELADVIRGDELPAPWSSLVPVQPKGRQRPFFYVAPYMISVLQFAHLGEELGKDQPLYGLQPRGLDGTEPPHTTIEDMAAHYIREMREVQPHGPYRIGGHCSGTWVAFEMARQLEAAGERIDALVLVDQGPPAAGRPAIKPWRYVVGRMRFYFSGGRLRQAVAWQARIIFNTVLLRRVGTGTVKYTEEVRATHRAAYQTYQGGVVRSDMALIRSDESLALEDKEWYLRWDQKTTGRVHYARSSGTHATLLERPYVEMLADRLRWAFGLSRSPAGHDIS